MWLPWAWAATRGIASAPLGVPRDLLECHLKPLKAIENHQKREDFQAISCLKWLEMAHERLLDAVR